MVTDFDPADLYTTGIPLIDEQHAQFADLIVRIHRQLVVNANESSCLGLLDELVAYAAYHFQSEENLMRCAGSAGRAGCLRRLSFPVGREPDALRWLSWA